MSSGFLLNIEFKHGNVKTLTHNINIEIKYFLIACNVNSLLYEYQGVSKNHAVEQNISDVSFQVMFRRSFLCLALTLSAYLLCVPCLAAKQEMNRCTELLWNSKPQAKSTSRLEHTCGKICVNNPTHSLWFLINRFLASQRMADCRTLHSLFLLYFFLWLKLYFSIELCEHLDLRDLLQPVQPEHKS